MVEVSAAMVDALTERVRDMEQNHKIEFHRWATPGETLASAALEVARTVCRRAERAVQALREAEAAASGTLGASGHPGLNPEIARYLNRLSDLLWLWARWMETRECGGQ
jgi:cob(I)alamin adenosyltransferase